MALPMITTYCAVLGTIVAYLIYSLAQIGRRPKDCPPGPPTLPLVGNLHLIPSKDPHLQFQKWAQEYGDVYSLMMGGRPTIVLSSAEAVKDLLDRKSAIYSDRPDLYTGLTLLSGGKRMGLMRYGAPWRAIRKLYHHTLHADKLPAYSPYQELESKQLVHDMMIEPADLLDHFKRYTSSLVTSVAYGFRWNSIHDPLLLKMSHNLDNFIRLNLTGSAALADIYPFLRYLPTWVLASKREAIANQASEDKMYADLYRTVKARIVADGPDSRPSVCKDVAEMQAQDGSSDEDVAYIPSQLWETGSDTTSAQLYGFAQALLLYPDVQTAGQAEVDRVVGPDRLPALHDMANLPYVRACVKETLRWLPIAILGAFPHASIKEDVYKGWRIPKGAMMMLNTWTIHRNPERYPNPGAFDPTRFINDNSTASESSKLEPSARDHFGFGAGRRICPGLNVAEQSMLLAIARIFWAVNVERVEGKVPTQDEFEPGFVAIPKSFEAGITPRSEARKDLVMREWEKAREGLDGGGQFLRGWMG